MSTREIVRKIQAYAAGQPLLHGETLRAHIAGRADILQLAFLRMGGESAPWAIGYRCGDASPNLLCVPEPRNRDAVADMIMNFAPTLLGHLRHPDWSNEAGTEHDPGLPLRQVWVPNGSHLEMLHHLAFAYAFTNYGSADRSRTLNAFGRAAGWLFRESRRPGQMTALVASDVLTESYTIPAETVRLAHLGYLIAWLTTRGGFRERIEAASHAERLSVSTTLAPQTERDNLAPLLEAWEQARTNGAHDSMQELAQKLELVLRPELLHRLGLVDVAIELLRRDPRPTNYGVHALRAASVDEYGYQYLRMERSVRDSSDGPAYTPSPETDRHPAAAAARFFVHENSEQLRAACLTQHDADLRAEALAAGAGFKARIVRVEDQGVGRSTVPIWTLEGADNWPLRLREGSQVCPAGVSARVGVLREVRVAPNGKRMYEVKIIHGIRARLDDTGNQVLPATSHLLEGCEVTMLAAPGPDLSHLRNQRIWNSDVPGAWLTHCVPAGRGANLPTEVAEDIDGIAADLERS